MANSGNNTIVKFTPAGVGSVFASTGLSLPMGLAFDSAGDLYAANLGNETIEKFTPDGTASVFARTGLRAPYGLAFDGAGNLYVALFAFGTVERFTPAGVGSFLPNMVPSILPNFLAIQQVPEPSTLALLPLGFAAFLGLRRRPA